MGGLCCAPRHQHANSDKHTMNLSIKFILKEQTSKSSKKGGKSYLDFEDFKKKFEWEEGADVAKDKKYKQPYEVEILENVGLDEMDKLRDTIDHFKTLSQDAMSNTAAKHHFQLLIQSYEDDRDPANRRFFLIKEMVKGKNLSE